MQEFVDKDRFLWFECFAVFLKDSYRNVEAQRMQGTCESFLAFFFFVVNSLHDFVKVKCCHLHLRFNGKYILRNIIRLIIWGSANVHHGHEFREEVIEDFVWQLKLFGPVSPLDQSLRKHFSMLWCLKRFFRFAFLHKLIHSVSVTHACELILLIWRQRLIWEKGLKGIAF